MYQTSKKINLREERDFGEKLNATFHFIKSNFKPLFRVLLLYVTPVALVAGIFSGLYQARMFQTITGTGDYNSLGEYTLFNQVTSLNYWIMLFFTVLGYIFVSLTVYSFMVVYMDEEEEVTPPAVWQHVKANLLQGIYAGTLIGVVCFFSLALVGLGLYLAVVFSIFFVVMVREELGVIDSLERCFYLIKRNWWATFGFILIVVFIQGMIGYLAALPVGIVTVLRFLEVPGMDSDILLVFANTLTSVLNIYISTIAVVAVGFQYFNLVEKKDGVGLMAQVGQIGNRSSHTFSNEGEF